MKITPEEVGYWYFRLNGFLTIPNFVLHPDQGGNQKSDVDLIGVRFPYRAELLRNPMRDDQVFTVKADRPFIAFVEIKRGRCEINRTMRTPEEKNIERALRAIGAIPIDDVDEAARIMYQTGSYVTDSCHISICCLGDTANDQIAEHFPDVRQILWRSILSFIYERFSEYRSRKADHTQWDYVGKTLWNASATCENEEEFVYLVQKFWNINDRL